MFLAFGFDKHIKHNYNMNAMNQNKYQKSWGQGDEIIEKQEREANE